jgi:hypothetical protein
MKVMQSLEAGTASADLMLQVRPPPSAIEAALVYAAPSAFGYQDSG